MILTFFSSDAVVLDGNFVLWKKLSNMSSINRVIPVVIYKRSIFQFLMFHVAPF